MSNVEAAAVRTTGSIVLPSGVRSALDLRAGDEVLMEFNQGGTMVLRLAQVVAPPSPEEYTPERKAEFLLSNAVSESDYQAAQDEVRRMGLDPATVAHYRHPRD
jgi:bifunctional DNA-binding transcriptional regulator/antitoxin component of YhaV-PrlF toxin-antitoxin module